LDIQNNNNTSKNDDIIETKNDDIQNPIQKHRIRTSTLEIEVFDTIIDNSRRSSVKPLEQSNNNNNNIRLKQ
jgi:hypothetical protein